MSLSKYLDRLASPREYSGGNKSRVRWGQLIRASATLAAKEAALIERGALVPLDCLGHIKGGIVTRANAYFLVRELAFDQIPARMRVTRADLKRIAVIEDGINFLAKIECEFLKPVIKGPESLESAFAIKRSDLRLFDVKQARSELERCQANGALAYLRRVETVNYKSSEDDLKGGIPARRSQVKNRRPYWYCLQGARANGVRIVFPEHIDRRYVFTLIDRTDESVVIDKLYVFEPQQEQDATILHASLNSLYTWYQLELRGRSQLGEGVLELKIPDYAGLHLLNPEHVSDRRREQLLATFADVPNPGAGPSLEELGTAARLAFDLAYLRACGFKDPEATLLDLERDLRALAGERHERRLSVAEAKVSRRKLTNVAASVDAHAARLAAMLEPHPDPRLCIQEGAQLDVVPILTEVDGTLDVGVELFNQGEVLAGDVCVARAGSILAAQFVRGVLLVQPDLPQVKVPSEATLHHTIAE